MPRTLSPEQKATMALGKARKVAIDAGLPDPFPNGVPGTKEAEKPIVATNLATGKVEPVPKGNVNAQVPVMAQPHSGLSSVGVKPEDKPAEPPKYGPHDVVRVYNPDNQDFHFRYGTKASYDAKGRVIENSIEPIMYTLPADQAISMHGYMADYVCNHLTSRILQKTGLTRQLNSPIVRKAWAAKIILGKEDIIAPEAKLSEAEQVQRQFEKLNTTSVTDEDNEVPLAEADELLSDIDQQTLEDNGEFPDAATTALTE